MDIGIRIQIKRQAFMIGTSQQIVQVINLSDLSEEEVTISANGHQLVCFISFCPYKIEVGLSYPVELTLSIFEDYSIEALSDDSPLSIKYHGTGYSYKIVGKLINGGLHSCGFIFNDSAFASDYEYLDGKTISIDVDRLDIEFLEIN